MMISQKYLHIWGPMDPLSLPASVILFIAVVQEMSHFGTLCQFACYCFDLSETGTGFT